jgi:DNA modification methylase
MISLPLDSIIQGNCIDILAQLPENSVDVIFADPPYNLQLSKDLYRPDRTKVDAVDDEWDKFDGFHEYDLFTHSWLSACRRVLKPNGTIWVIGTYHNIYRVGAILQDLGYWILNDIVWIKNNPMPNFRGARFTNAHETLIWAQKKPRARYTFNHHSMKSLNEDLQMRSDWYLPICTGRERLKANQEKAHTTQKPEALLRRVLLASTNPGDVVLDPFFGTGTTGAMAKRLGRHFIGIEQDPAYIDVAKERIREAEPISEEALQVSNPRSRRRIPFGALLENSLLEAGQTLFLVEKDLCATILVDGSLKCGSHVGSIHGLAKLLLNAPVNGWDCWFFEDASGIRQPIDNLRKELRLLKGEKDE